MKLFGIFLLSMVVAALMWAIAIIIGSYIFFKLEELCDYIRYDVLKKKWR